MEPGKRVRIHSGEYYKGIYGTYQPIPGHEALAQVFPDYLPDVWRKEGEKTMNCQECGAPIVTVIDECGNSRDRYAPRDDDQKLIAEYYRAAKVYEDAASAAGENTESLFLKRCLARFEKALQAIYDRGNVLAQEE